MSQPVRPGAGALFKADRTNISARLQELSQFVVNFQDSRHRCLFRLRDQVHDEFDKSAAQTIAHGHHDQLSGIHTNSLRDHSLMTSLKRSHVYNTTYYQVRDLITSIQIHSGTVHKWRYANLWIFDLLPIIRFKIWQYPYSFIKGPFINDATQIWWIVYPLLALSPFITLH